MLKHVPNLISGARLLAGPVLVWLALSQREAAFAWLMVGSLASDAVDGYVARRFNLQSRLGAALDSAADVSTLAIAGYGILVFRPEVWRDHALACGLVVGGWLLVCAIALLRYRRLSSFHTLLSKASGYAFGLFLAVLFVHGFEPWLFYAMATLSVVGSVEELALLWRLPTWRTDVKGLWWVLRERS